MPGERAACWPMTEEEEGEEEEEEEEDDEGKRGKTHGAKRR